MYPQISSHEQSVASAGVQPPPVRKSSVPPPPDLIDKLRAAIREALPNADHGLPVIARRLGLSPRTLQRRLFELGLSYTNLVDEERQVIAEGLLKDSSVSICQVVYKLGFSDGKSFRRAFRRWRGTSPAQYRHDFRTGQSSAPPPPDDSIEADPLSLS